MRYSYRRIAQTAAVSIAFVAAVCSVTSRMQAAPYITVGPSDGFAFDQPRVAIAVVDPTAPGGPSSLGPEFFNEFLLDTGSSSVLVAGLAVGELQDQGYQTVAQYSELGVAGAGLMDVSKPYEVNFAGSDGSPIAIDNIRLLSTPEPTSFGSFMGIIGMPAMVGRTTTMDMTIWSGGNIDLMVTAFSSAPPAPSGVRFNIPLTLKNFPQNGQIFPTDPLPSSAPLPMVPVEMRTPGHLVQDQFVLDSGAQLSIVSTATALGLGLDTDGDGNLDNEALDFIEVQGISGSVLMPLVEAGTIAVRSQSGAKLVWTDLVIGVLDIDPGIPGEPPIPGIFGADLLTSGWLGAIFGGPDGYFNQVHFDFRDAANLTGTMVLDMNPSLNVVSYEGDVNQDGQVDIFDLNLVANHWLSAGGPGDANGDGIVNIFDINVISQDWGSPGPSLAAAVLSRRHWCWRRCRW